MPQITKIRLKDIAYPYADKENTFPGEIVSAVIQTATLVFLLLFAMSAKLTLRYWVQSVPLLLVIVLVQPVKELNPHAQVVSLHTIFTNLLVLHNALIVHIL